MDSPYELILFGVAFCIFAMIVITVQARRKKDKTGYFVALIPFFMLLVFVFIILNQRLLVIIFFASAAIAAIASLPMVTKMLERESAERAKKVDLSAPFRRRDFLKDKMWLKLAQRWGVWKTVGIYSLVIITVIAGMLYIILSRWGIMDIWYVVGYTISATIGFAILFYRQISKALKESKRHPRTKEKVD